MCEPCVGGGAILLAVNEELRERRFQPHHWWFDATDLDQRCFHMAYVQLTLCGAPGVVRWGDTIRMTQRDAWLTLTGALFPLRRSQADEETAPSAPVATAPPPAPSPVKRDELAELLAVPPVRPATKPSPAKFAPQPTGTIPQPSFQLDLL